MSEMEFESRMSDADALMWNIEKDPGLRSTIVAVSMLDTSPDRDRLLDKIERGTRMIPRLRQRVVGNAFSLAPPRWEIDPHFDLGYHVRFVSVGPEGTDRDVLDMAQLVGMQGFDRARPLWEFLVVDGLPDGRAALVQKIHHAITDGVGGIKIAMMILDLERDPEGPEEPMPPAPPVDVLSPSDRTRDALTHIVRRNMGITKRLLDNAPSQVATALTDPAALVQGAGELVGSLGRMLAPATEPLSPLMTGRSLSIRFEQISMPLADLKAASKLSGGKLNDGFVAGVAGGFMRYHERNGAPVEALRMNMPINVRTADTADVAGNQFAPARFPVPMNIEDPIERMQIIRELVAGQRAEPAMGLTETMAGVLNRLPTTATTALFGSMLKGCDFTTSNVPGAPIATYIAGAEVTSMVPFGPLAGVAVNVTLVSNIDEVIIGINIDTRAVPDHELLVECFQESFDEIIGLR
nr:putative wax ester synthase/acyl-CoA:diacylglycerol acyltransferase [uncultured bacterium]